MVCIKGNPIFATGVGLWGCPDTIIPMPAEKRLLDLVKPGELGPKFSLADWGVGPFLHEGKDKEG